MSNTSRINAEDQGGKLVLAVALMLAYTIIVYATRLPTRWPWKAGTFSSEDYFLLGAVALSITYSAVLAAAVQHGMGQHVTVLSDQQTHYIRKAMLSSILLARLTECLSFFSLASLIKKVSAFVLQKRLMVYVYTSIVVWTCTTLLLEGIEISAASITPAAFIVVGAAPAAILVTLFAIMMHMIWSTKLRLHIKVSTTLWLLLIPCVAAFILVRVIRAPSPPLHGDFTFSSIRFFVWFTIEVNLCIIGAACVSFMRFARNATTGFMGQMLPPEVTTLDGSSVKTEDKTEGSSRVAVREIDRINSDSGLGRGTILVQKTVMVEQVNGEYVD